MYVNKCSFFLKFLLDILEPKVFIVIKDGTSSGALGHNELVQIQTFDVNRFHAFSN